MLCSVLLASFMIAASYQESALASGLGSVGYYSRGCLIEGARLGDAGPGFVKLFLERDRDYGNFQTIELLHSLGQAYVDAYQRYATPERPFERIQFGDLSQKGGGKITRHNSHQHGLDVDGGYFRRDFRETDPRRGFDASFDEDFVKGGRLSDNFDLERNWWLFRWLYMTGKVDRIFVDREIKRQLCQASPRLEPFDSEAREGTLRLLRPYSNHSDHWHLRILCPTEDLKCVASPPIAPGSGCDLVNAALRETNSSYGEPVDGEVEALLNTRARFKPPRKLPQECLRPRGIF